MTAHPGRVTYTSNVNDVVLDGVADVRLIEKSFPWGPFLVVVAFGGWLAIGVPNSCCAASRRSRWILAQRDLYRSDRPKFAKKWAKLIPRLIRWSRPEVPMKLD